ncbi:acidic protein msyB [Klebsiella michiganensis]|nr:acidic protein msyB [Klebsiella michiganensis]
MPKDSMFYATLEEAIDAAREEFLANNPDSDEESASIEQLNIQKYVLQDGDIAWQAEFSPMRMNRANVCRSSAVRLHRASLTAIMMRLSFARSGWKKTRCMNGMKASFSLNPLLIPRRARQPPMNGMNAN